MNAGAYGGEMKDIVQNVTVLTREGEIRELEKEELGFGYRASVIKDRGYVKEQFGVQLEPEIQFLGEF